MRPVKSMIHIPFNKPHITGKEYFYIKQTYKNDHLAGDGEFTKKAQLWLEEKFGNPLCLLTHSATGALEMMAMLSNVGPGDEVIIPDYTFVSTANAFVLRGATPVFVDVRSDTINLDERLIEQALTKKTKVIVPVHYAGVACEMDSIQAIAKKHSLLVVEDAAQGFLSTYRKKYLGTIGDMAAFSFHDTKNVISGEGGSLLINNHAFFDRAKIIWEKGTNRSMFLEGKVDKYTWVDIGSSYLPGEITAAFLMAQLEKSIEINRVRMMKWNRYHNELLGLEKVGKLRRPIIPSFTKHNAHMYYILTRNEKEKIGLIRYLKTKGILAVSHYVPLHSSPGGRKFGRHIGTMHVSNLVGNTLVRLPLFYDLKDKEQTYILENIHDYYRTT